MRGLTRLLGLRGLKIAITLFGLASALVAFGTYAIASHYHPDTSGLWVYLATAVGLTLIPVAILPAKAGRTVWKRFVALPVAAILGPPLAIGGAYLTITDLGDLILWIWPLLLGVALCLAARRIWQLG